MANNRRDRGDNFRDETASGEFAMNLAKRLAQTIKNRDELTLEHYHLGGIHADHGTRNCSCELAARARLAGEECEKLVFEKYRNKTDVEFRDEALEEAAQALDDVISHSATQKAYKRAAEIVREMKSGSP